MKTTYPKHVIFVTGASGSGKTALVSRLQGKFALENNIVFLHFDAVGIPSERVMTKEYGSPSKWQKEMTHLWIDKIIKDYTRENIVIIEGSVNPEFIKDAFEKHGYKDYRIVLVDYDESDMKKRLVEKRRQPELLNKDMISWLKFLRVRAEEVGAKIINSSSFTESQMVKEFIKLTELSK
jgi:molybdopterin-guanine dinucleotide biosynthesis protein